VLYKCYEDDYKEHLPIKQRSNQHLDIMENCFLIVARKMNSEMIQYKQPETCNDERHHRFLQVNPQNTRACFKENSLLHISSAKAGVYAKFLNE